METCGAYGFFNRQKFYVYPCSSEASPRELGVSIVSQLRQAIRKRKLKVWRQKIEELVDLKDDTFDCFEISGTNCLQYVLDYGYFQNHVDSKGLPRYGAYTYIINLDEETFDCYIENTCWISCPFPTLKSLQKIMKYMR
jgi:hypothetical protein